MKKTTKESKKEESAVEVIKMEYSNKGVCSNCNTKISGKKHTIEGKGNKLMELCDKCYQKIDSALKMQSKGTNYPLAIIFGLIFGIVGAFIWFGAVVITKWQVGLIAVIAGLLTGWGVSIGAGRKKSVNLQILSAIIALISILFGEYLIMNHYARQYLIEQGYVITSYFGNLFLIMEFVFSSISKDPLTLLFWGIAVWVAYSIPRPLKLKKVE